MNYSTIDRAIEYLGWSLPAAYGAVLARDNSCKCRDRCHCNVSPWSVATRRRFRESLVRAQEQARAYLGEPLMPAAEVSEFVTVAPGQCSAWLDNPIGYLGKRVQVDLGAYALEYSADGDCAEDYVGYILIPTSAVTQITLDSGLSSDELVEHLIASYPAYCAHEDTKLPEPFCIKVDGSGIVIEWKKYHLIEPAACNVSLNDETGFLEKVQLSYWQIDESVAIEAVGECACDKCTRECAGKWKATINNATCGELCISADGCGCGKKSSAFMVHYGIEKGDLSVSMQDTIALLALVRMGAQSPCVTCAGFGDPNGYLEAANEIVSQHEGIKDFPFGVSVAAVTAQRLLEQERKRREQRDCMCDELRSHRRVMRRTGRNFRTLWTSDNRSTRRLSAR